MSWYGIDAVDKAVSRTRRALFEPFDFWKWVKLAIIIFLLGGISSNYGGSGTNYRMSPEDLEILLLFGYRPVDSGYIPHDMIIEKIYSPVTSFAQYGLIDCCNCRSDSSFPVIFSIFPVLWNLFLWNPW